MSNRDRQVQESAVEGRGGFSGKYSEIRQSLIESLNRRVGGFAPSVSENGYRTSQVLKNLAIESGVTEEGLAACLVDIRRLTDTENGELSKEGREVLSVCALNILTDRTWSETDPTSLNAFQLPPERTAESQGLFDRQREKRAIALKIFENLYGPIRSWDEESAVPRTREEQNNRAAHLLRLIEHALDPDFGDPELAARLCGSLPPSERRLYMEDGEPRSLLDKRLRRYANFGEANGVEEAGGRDPHDKKELTEFYLGRREEITYDGQTISIEDFRDEVAAARVQVNIGPEAFRHLVEDGRYKTVHENKAAEDEWERLNPGYCGRRRSGDERMGIIAKGTAGDEHVISGYLWSPGMAEASVRGRSRRPNGYGILSLKMRPKVTDRSGFIKGDALAKQGSEGAKLSLESAVLVGAHSQNFSEEVGSGNYIEAQIYGGVSLDDVEDIEYSGRVNDVAKKELREFFKGLPVRSVLDLAARMPNFRQMLLDLLEADGPLAARIKELPATPEPETPDPQARENRMRGYTEELAAMEIRPAEKKLAEEREKNFMEQERTRKEKAKREKKLLELREQADLAEAQGRLAENSLAEARARIDEVQAEIDKFEASKKEIEEIGTEIKKRFSGILGAIRQKINQKEYSALVSRRKELAAFINEFNSNKANGKIKELNRQLETAESAAKAARENSARLKAEEIDLAA